MRKFVITAISFGFMLLVLSVSNSQACTDPGSIVSVKNTTSGNFEYVTFMIKKPLNPDYGYAVTTTTGPFTEQPSGNPVTITGPKYKKIRFKGITWMCTIAETFSLPKPAIKAIKKLEQHEGIVVYVVGYRNVSTYLSTTSSNVGLFRKVVMKFKK